MKTGHILLFFTFPIVLEGCCAGKKKENVKVSGLEKTWQYVRAVEGESFMMPCMKSADGHIKVVWSKTGHDRGHHEGTSFSCGTVPFPAEAKHTGKYHSLASGVELVLHLQVVQKSRVGCLQPDSSSTELFSGVEGQIPCPGHNCTDNNQDVTWYKRNISVSHLRRNICVKNGQLHLCEVKEDKKDEGLYFCDRPVTERGVTWTFRRAVNVKVVPTHNIATGQRPKIRYPDANVTEKVELVAVGQAHTLTCKVLFHYEKTVSATVQWYMNYGGNMKRRTKLDMESPLNQSVVSSEYCITQRAIIKTVTPQHLYHTYTCFASNAAGNISATIKLQKKWEVKWMPYIEYPVAVLLLAVGVAIFLHTKSLELQIIYRSNFQFGKQHGEKQFDVFLSHVWSSTSAEMEGGWTLSSPSGTDADEEAHQRCMNLTNTEEGQTNQRPQAMLLHQVLEEQWGYRLCLLERDVVPGGAYANDVVGAIQRSQMLVCLLSADYLHSNNAVFVLESGIQALLQKSAPKLLLIWTCRDPATLIQEAPLPSRVQRALKVLPHLNWATGKPARSSCDFWTSLKKAMPRQRVKQRQQLV